MANQVANKNYWTFVKGIITETSPLLYPENASIDEANFVLNRDGSRERRLGIDYEPAYSLVNLGSPYATLSPTAISSFDWKGVGGVSSVTLSCVQVSSTLYFFDANETSQSSNQVGTVTLSASALYSPLSYASTQGNLIVASKEIGQVVISPTFTAGVISGFTNTDIQLSIRDIYGVDDGLAIDERPLSLSDEHKYNLMNQGWTETLINTFFSAKGVYPSNADIWHVAKDASNNFNSDYLVNTHFGTTYAPKGRYVLDAFSRGESRADETGLILPTDKEVGKVGCVASYSGRVFYSGVEPNLTDPDSRSPMYPGIVFFSKLAESVDDLGKCYSEADPTSEEISDIIASDGGTVNILEAYNIVAMKEVSGSLVVLAENGVWVLSGTDKGFSALDYILRKVSDVGCISADSVVVIEGNTVLYWSNGGIYAITGDDISGLKVESITVSTIQSLYEEIPVPVRRNVKGIYDPISKKARWLYTTSSTYNSAVNPHLFDKELILDTVLEAFYVNTLDATGPHVVGYIKLTGEVSSSLTYSVVVGADSVVIGTDSVVATYDYTSGTSSGIKYITVVPNSNMYLTFSLFNNPSFVDWETYDSVGKNYESYMISGYELMGDSMRNKQVEYIVFHFLRTETAYVATVDGVAYDYPSSCLVQTRYDFSDSANSGKWSSEFQAYRLNRLYIPSGVGGSFDYGQSVISTKSKVRGKGRAISFKVRSEAGKDMKLLGWAVQYSGNSSV